MHTVWMAPARQAGTSCEKRHTTAKVVWAAAGTCVDGSAYIVEALAGVRQNAGLQQYDCVKLRILCSFFFALLLVVHFFFALLLVVLELRGTLRVSKGLHEGISLGTDGMGEAHLMKWLQQEKVRCQVLHLCHQQTY